MATKLSGEQVQKAVYDEVLGALRVVLASVSTQIELDANDGDSIKAIQGVEPLAAWDYIGYAYPDAVTVVETYRDGGSGGNVVGTVTKVYVDATHERLVSQARS